jgi:hypothetical protein
VPGSMGAAGIITTIAKCIRHPVAITDLIFLTPRGHLRTPTCRHRRIRLRHRIRLATRVEGFLYQVVGVKRCQRAALKSL